MAKYYAVQRSEEFLAHYGVKGMKWRVRKAVKRGNYKAYKRYEKKATRKLEKFEKEAMKGAKYTKRAVMSGAKMAATGGMVAVGIRNPSMLAYRAGMAGYNAYKAANARTAAQKAQAWRNEMEREFNLDAIEFRPKRRHGRRRHY